jgi:hypothetical protein
MSKSADAPRLQVLTTYAYLNKNMIGALEDYSSGLDLLLDSGAFTAWQKGETIRLDDYCRALDGLPFKPWRYFTLDVVGDHKATAENYGQMLARGYSPVPIFTRGSPYEELDGYARTSDMIGLGGLAGKEGNRYAYLKAMWPRTAGKNMHILGVTSPDWIKHLRPYSCDSSTWNGAGRYGMVNLYMGRGRWEMFRPRALDARPSGEVAARIARYGFDPYTLGRTDKAWQQINNLSWAEFSIEIRAALGTRLFLAAAIKRDLEWAVEAHARVLEIRGRSGAKAA